jgi:glucose-1-phosphate cytidylyltransferase
MKAVLLAGGLGTRMREETEFRPKPMVEVGGRPVLWHIMKVLGSQGITDFVICTGYKSEYIKNYFYNYGASNLDFTVRLGDQSSTVFHGSHDEFDWKVTVADTGLTTMTGGHRSSSPPRFPQRTWQNSNYDNHSGCKSIRRG